jgi:hypothetical protein
MDSFYDLGLAEFNLRKIELKSEICSGQNNSYRTEYPHIIRLCRTCITDICKKLTELINFETARYRSYVQGRERLLSSDTPNPELLEDIDINITDAKYQYNKYYTLYQDLLKKKLCPKKCVICFLDLD